MARSQVRGGNKLRRNFKTSIENKNARVKKAVTAAAFVIGSRSDERVPVDTKALMNSRFTKVIPMAQAWRGIIGYTQDYAAALHERTDWKPKPPGSPGKRTGGYNANAEPLFLEKGADDAMPTITRIFIEELRV